MLGPTGRRLLSLRRNRTARATRAHPFLRADGPLAFAHRGFSAVYPENTMPAFEAAIELGCRYLETDVLATSDGIPVIFHDELLERVSNEEGPVAARSWGLLRRVRLGEGESIPCLAELLDAWPSVHVNIDPKSDEVLAPLLSVLDEFNAWDRVCVGSFSGRRLKRLRQMAGSKLCTSAGPSEVTRMVLGKLGLPAVGVKANCLQVPVRRHGVRIVDASFLKTCGHHGLPVHVWTINRRADMEELLDLGVDGIMTDRLDVLKEVFEERQLAF